MSWPVVSESVVNVRTVDVTVGTEVELKSTSTMDGVEEDTVALTTTPLVAATDTLAKLVSNLAWRQLEPV